MAYAATVQAQEDRRWIEERYGPITTEVRPLHLPGSASRECILMTVPILKRVAVGIGMTEDQAVHSLRFDLVMPAPLNIV